MPTHDGRIANGDAPAHADIVEEVLHKRADVHGVGLLAIQGTRACKDDGEVQHGRHGREDDRRRAAAYH